MDVIIAARLSRKGYGETQTGIDTQDEDARAWAERKGHRVVAVVAERIPGHVSPFDRKELGPWLTEPAKISQYQGIVFAKIDRAGRARDWKVRQWAEDNGKKLFIVFPELEWPPADPADTITPQMWDMLLNQAIAEWQNTSQRYRRMQRALRQNNLLVGRPNYGYRAMQSGDHKTLVPDKLMAPLLREAIQHYIEDDWSLLDCCDWLADNGAVRVDGKPFRPTSLGVIFRNSSLYGRRSRKDGRTELRIAEPILSRERWDALQAKMDKKAGRKGVASKKTAMLTSIVHCALCRRPMYRQYAHPHGRGRAYYRCRGTDNDQSTCKNMVPLLEANRAFSDAVMQYRDLPHTEHVYRRGADHSAEIGKITDEMHDLVDSGPLDGAKLARLKELSDQQQRLQDGDKEADKGRHVIRLTGKTVGEHWASLDDAGKRAWALELGWKAYAQLPEGEDVPTFGIEGESSIFDDIAILTGLTADQIMAIRWVPILAALRERGLPTDPAEIERLAKQPTYVPDEVKRAVEELLAPQPASEGQ
jgi:DNA invertase Pin-like site-specific DNA recombinase